MYTKHTTLYVLAANCHPSLIYHVQCVHLKTHVTHITQDEEDGFKYGNPASPSHRSPYPSSPPSNTAGGIDVDYLGDFNNNAELQAMRREMSKFSTRNAASGAISSTGKGRGTIADTYKRGSGNTSKMRALRPLGQVQVEEEEELPAGGNCVVM